MLIQKCLVILCLVPIISIWAKLSEMHLHLRDGSPLQPRYMKTPNGRGILAFTNIPYAEPPVGPLRFADPIPKAPWTEDLNNQHDIILCPQLDFFFVNGMYMGQEDCLVLNVYVPVDAPTHESLPVLFFIHGGGFKAGTGNPMLYGPDHLLDKNLILVTGNYRLSALGYMSTYTKEFPGNYGMKDQVLMLKWIQANIANFGGDPNQVTVMGESAGAASVNLHMLSPMSKGLFHRAIMQSGSAFTGWSNITRSQSLKYATQMLDIMGCPKDDHKAALDCMRQKTAEDILINSKLLYVWHNHSSVDFGPVLEENSLNPYLTKADFMNEASGGDIPLIFGLNANEGGMWPALYFREPEVLAEFEKRFDEVLPTVIFWFDKFDNETMARKVASLKSYYIGCETFRYESHKHQFVRLLSDNLVLVGFSEVMKRRFASKADTFVYKFNHRGAASFADFGGNPDTTDFGVAHADELITLFPISKNVGLKSMTAEDHDMREQVVEMWYNFVAKGNPSTAKNQWTPAKRFPIDYLRIGNHNAEKCDSSGITASVMQTGLFEERRYFIDNINEWSCGSC